MQRLQKNCLTVVFSDAAGEAIEVLYPRIVLLEVEEVDLWFGFIWTVVEVERVEFLAFGVVVGVHVDPEMEPRLQVRDLIWGDGVLDGVERGFVEVVIVVVCPVWVMCLFDLMEAGKDCVAEASVIMILHVYNALFVGESGRGGVCIRRLREGQSGEC